MPEEVVQARWLLTRDALLAYPVIRLDAEGVITAIESGVAHDGEGVLASALFDVHMHGAAGHDVMEGTPAALHAVEAFLSSRGVARYLATTVTAPLESTLRSLDRLAAHIEQGAKPGLAQPVGIHLEGPFLSHIKRGVHPPAHLLAPSVSVFEKLQTAARGQIRLITLAPELPGALELVRHAEGSGVTVSIGHTNAMAAETEAAIDAGARSATHTFNAMRALDHREPGVLGTVLDDERIYAELICDGIHVSPPLVRLWLKAKGADRAILVTDSMAAAGMPDGRYQLGELEVDVHDGRCLANGVLAGSVLTLDQAVSNVCRYTGASVPVALQLASINPSNMLGTPELVNIRVGQPANLVLFSEAGVLRDAYVGGLRTTPVSRSESV